MKRCMETSRRVTLRETRPVFQNRRNRQPWRALALAGLALLVPGCKSAPQAPVAQPPAAAAQASTHENLNSVLWVQRAAEFRASSLQAFAWARQMLDRALPEPSWTAALEQMEQKDQTAESTPSAQGNQKLQKGQKGQKGKKSEPAPSYAGLPPAIIVDVDDTVLDNSAYQARLIADEAQFTKESWYAWAAERKATAVPGALEFIQYAHSQSVRVFYVTNRDADLEEPTRANLLALGFPVSEDPDTLLTRKERPEWNSDKSSRRAAIAERYRVLLVVGDNLGDFAPDHGVPLDQRNESVATTYGSHWGTRWIMIPNPMYGTWEAAITGYREGLSRDELLRQKYQALEELRDR